jgi:hypothetical protein
MLKSVPKQAMAEYRQQVESLQQRMSADETQVVHTDSKDAPPQPGNGKG